MGLLDIDEVKELTKEYFRDSGGWWKTYESPRWAVYTRHIRIEANLNSNNEHYQKIGELTLSYHFQTNFKNKNNKLQIYFIPASYHYLPIDAEEKFDKLIKTINEYVKPYLSNDVNDQLTLSQYIGGICAWLKEKDLRLIEFTF